RIGEGVERRLVGEIDCKRTNRAPRMGGLQRIGKLMRRVARRAKGEIDVVAVRRERPHDCRAHALAAARDENPPPGSHRHQAGSAVKTRQVLWPPKPNELDRTRATLASRATFGTTSSWIDGSGMRWLMVGGITPFAMVISDTTASTAPAAVSVWPSIDL